MANVFISYSDTDKTTVKRISAILEAKGYSVWWDQHIEIGKKFDRVIEEELKQADCVLVVWTKRSVQSEWVRLEAEEALRSKKIVPILLEEVELPLVFKNVESAMMHGWNGSDTHPELKLLFRAIDAKVKVKGGTLGGGNFHTRFAFLFQRYRKSFFVVGITLLVATIIYIIIQSRTESTLVIRVFDWKKNQLKDGEVKLFLDEYIRTQSIDKEGQALFTKIPSAMFAKKVKMEISSPGYTTKIVDTLLSRDVMEISLPFKTVIQISGRVKTASELPIKDVEINVDGTRYFAISITDGSYSLTLDEYTLGDEISITTSHPRYEDKTFALTIQSPVIANTDIFLQPIHP